MTSPLLTRLTKLLVLCALFVAIALISTARVKATISYGEKNKFVSVMFYVWHDYVNKLEDDYGRCLYSISTFDSCTRTGYSDHYPVYGEYQWWGIPSIATPANYRFMATENEPADPNMDLINHHASLLTAAGVDYITVVVDYTTAQAADRQQHALAALLKGFVTRAGQEPSLPSPKVALYLVGAGSVLDYYLDHFYEESYYHDLWFRIDGKPLIMIADNFSCTSQEALDKLQDYACRGIAGLDATSSTWNFKNPTPQVYYSLNGWPEEMSVSAAYQTDHMNRSAESSPYNTPAAVGRNSMATFHAQWDQANLVANPTHVLVSSWNEWVAQNHAGYNDGNYSPHDGNTRPRQIFVDQFNQEYSSDIEPMSGGHGSDYYDDLATQIAKYKRNVPNFAFRNTSNGQWTFKFYRGEPLSAPYNYTAWTGNWTSGTGVQPFVGDFDEDGEVDIGIRDTSSGTWYFTNKVNAWGYSNNNNFTWTAGSQYEPIVGDWDHDGHLDIGLYDSSSGYWYFRRRTSAFTFGDEHSWGAWAQGSVFQPFVGDFNKDGYADVGVRDTSSGIWYFADSNGTWTTNVSNSLAFYANHSVTWTSGSGMQAVTGDFDGDGVFDIGMRETSTGRIYLANGNVTSGVPNYSFSNDANFIWATGTNYQIKAFSKYTAVTVP